MDEILKRDQNFIVVLGGVTDDANEYIRMFRVDPATGALLISAAGLGTGTVTSIAAGIGILATPDPITTTGTIALSVALQPIAALTGNGGKFLRVNAGETAVEYITVSPGSGTVTTVSVATANGFAGTVANATTTPAITLTTSITGILQGNGTAISAATTTGSGSVVLAGSPTLTGSPLAPTQTPGDNSTKIATTAYVDAAVSGQNYKEAAKYATIAALPAVTYSNGASGVGATLTEVGLGALSVDGVTPSVGDRILVKNQVAQLQNGIYIVTVVGTAGVAFVLTRSSDFDQASEINSGDSLFVSAGNTLSTTTWAYNGTDNPVMGTDSLSFTQTAGQGSFTAGNGISITGVSIAIDTNVTVDKTTAQELTNKTLTSSVLKGTFTASGTVTMPTLTMGGNLVMGTNSITMTGSLAATGARVTKGWFTDVESTNMYTVGGTSLSSTFAPIASPTFTGTVTLPTTSLTGVMTLAENASIALDPAGSADGKYTGITMTATSGYSQAFGDLVYLDAATSRWKAADADAAATADRMLAMVVVAGTDGNACTLLLQGNIRADAKFPALTIGSPVYVGEATGEIQVAIPTGADNVIKRVGFALTADEIYFCPSTDAQTTVA